MSTVIGVLFAVVFVTLVVYANLKKKPTNFSQDESTRTPTDGFEVDTDPGDDNRYI